MATTKTALITGAAKRIGRTIALDLARHGWNLALHYNGSEREARATEADVKAQGVKAVLLRCDLSHESETRTLISNAKEAIGAVTALVNNASIFENDVWQNATRAGWDQHMEVNLRAPLVLAQEFARHLPTGQKGAIVNLLDQRMFKPTPQFLSYGVSKAGLHWLTTTLAQGMAPDIRVNAVAPGPTMINARQNLEDFRHQREATILGTGAEPQDVAAAVRYLLEASAVTGQTIAVDGGQHLIWQTPDVRVKE